MNNILLVDLQIDQQPQSNMQYVRKLSLQMPMKFVNREVKSSVACVRQLRVNWNG